MHAINAFRHLHQTHFTTLLNRREIHFNKTPFGIAEISFSAPQEKVNVLTLANLETLGNLLTQLKTSNCTALVIDIKNLAGADLRMIREGLDDPVLLKKIVDTGHRVFDQLANFPKPTFAFISIACLGGGAELALSCDYRIVTDDPNTLLGFPEIKLGLFPCWGGTQRLPRLVGGPQALNLILNGESVTGTQARKMQLVDAIFSRDVIKEKGREFIASCLTFEGKQQVSENRDQILMPNWPGFAHKRYMDPGLQTCELMYSTNELSLTHALRVEKKVFLGLPPETFKQAKHLITAFLEKKPPFVTKE